MAKYGVPIVLLGWTGFLGFLVYACVDDPRESHLSEGLFLALGVGLSAASLGSYITRKEAGPAPAWLLAILGGSFVAAGAGLPLLMTGILEEASLSTTYPVLLVCIPPPLVLYVAMHWSKFRARRSLAERAATAAILVVCLLVLLAVHAALPAGEGYAVIGGGRMYRFSTESGVGPLLRPVSVWALSAAWVTANIRLIRTR
jgi:hypothetical protein